MRQRSSYPKSFKAQVVQECLQPGATISGVAISHGDQSITVKWPTSDPEGCARFVRGLTQ